MSHRTVFILGAGASREAGAPMMRDFLDIADVVRELQPSGSQTRESFDLVFRAIAELDPVFAKSRIEVDNIESIFATFEMAELFGRLGTLKEVEVNRLTPAIKSVIATTLEERLIFPTSGGQVLPPYPYDGFIKLVNDIRKPTAASNTTQPVTIMTFNYELAVDYAFHFNRIQADYCLSEPDSGTSISLLKLHGSFNWSRCSNSKCNVINVVKFDELLGGQQKWLDPYGGKGEIKLPLSTRLPQCRSCGVPSKPEPLIIPPTWNKTKHYAEIRGVWSTAARHLSQAENIVVIGYSLPETDHFFHYLYALGAVGATRLKRFLIFNSDPAVKDRFGRLLGPVAKDRMRHFQSGFSESLTHLRNELVRA
jgi:NAD-dependent SIR2 family protein deacetylase